MFLWDSCLYWVKYLTEVKGNGIAYFAVYNGKG